MYDCKLLLIRVYHGMTAPGRLDTLRVLQFLWLREDHDRAFSSLSLLLQHGCVCPLLVSVYAPEYLLNCWYTPFDLVACLLLDDVARSLSLVHSVHPAQADSRRYIHPALDVPTMR